MSEQHLRKRNRGVADPKLAQPMKVRLHGWRVIVPWWIGLAVVVWLLVTELLVTVWLTPDEALHLLYKLLGAKAGCNN